MNTTMAVTETSKTSHPDLPANRYTYQEDHRYTYQEDHRHNDRGRFPGAAGHYSPSGTKSNGFTAVAYYNMSYNACPPPAWITSNPLYDQSTGLPPSVTADRETTPVILEEPGGVAQRGNDAPFPSTSPPNNTRKAFPPTDTRAIYVESNKQSDSVINVSAYEVAFGTNDSSTPAVSLSQLQTDGCTIRKSINPNHLLSASLHRHRNSPVPQKTKQALVFSPAGIKTATTLQRTTCHLHHSSDFPHWKNGVDSRTTMQGHDRGSG